jgi:hypothetical protein
MTEDVLADFPPLRQAAIIRQYLVDGLFLHDDCVQRYRTPADIRIAVATEVAFRRHNAKRLSHYRSYSCHRERVREPSREHPASGWRGRMFTELSAAVGSQCWACGMNPACHIDHDHFTGDVRGLLCAECNPSIDGCLHPESSECFAAAYLNSPSSYFGLKYRPENKVKRLDRVRCHVLGFNMFDVSCWPSKIPAQWNWSPPPDDSLRHIDASVLRKFRAEWGTAGEHVIRAQGNA